MLFLKSGFVFDVARVCESPLIGEIIEMRGDKASIQVYEETSGLGPGAPVESIGEPLSMGRVSKKLATEFQIINPRTKQNYMQL
jgi:vacuolar-type H+-ATPase subunit B/Vma2